MLIDEAARRKADIICLPEGLTVVGTGKPYADVAEPIPGPTTEFLGRKATQHKVYLVAGLYERDGRVIHNTSVLTENQLYLVTSGCDFRTAIFDRAGDTLVQAETDRGVIVTEVDLNQRRLWPWLGDWRSRIWREGPASD